MKDRQRNGLRQGSNLQGGPGGALGARLTALVVMLALPASAGMASPAPRPEGSPALGAQKPQLGEFSDDIEEIVEQILPAVVQIVVTGYAVQQNQSSDLLSRRRSGGSGVVVDPTGYIVTNAHVVDGARRIQVRMPSRTVGEGQSILRPSGDLAGATLIGIDQETDLAVLKVQRQALHYLELGDSDEIRPGEMVLAFGAPFGLENSVTLGIVSAQARQLRPEDPMIYIQTDAPINPGNSGGPLVDMVGRVVGINTLIFSQSGGNEGIGFAAPSNIVRFVYEQIRESRRVVRGAIGARTQTVTPLLSNGLGLPQDWGVVVSDVYPNSPAAGADLRIGDIILSINSKTMENARQFEVNLYRATIGQQVELGIARGGEVFSRQVTVVERPDMENPFASLVSPEQNLVESLGLLCIDVNEQILRLLPGMRIQTGVLVAAKRSDAGPASGFIPGDVIHAVNGASIESLAQLKQELANILSLQPVVIQIERRGELQFLAFEMER